MIGLATNSLSYRSFVGDFDHAGGDGQQCFAGSGGPQQCRQFDVVIEQQVHGHGLLQVARQNAEDRFPGSVNWDQVVRVGKPSCQTGV